MPEPMCITLYMMMSVFLHVVHMIKHFEDVWKEKDDPFKLLDNSKK